MSVNDEITDAVDEALREDMSPKEFIAEVQNAWEIALSERQRRDREAFQRALDNMDKI